MLKKTGIIVAAVAAGVVGLSSLAFATTSTPAPHVDQTSIEQGNLSNDCEFGQDAGTASQTLLGGDSVLGVAGAVTGGVAPTQLATQALNCTNVNVTDVIDVDSGNTTDTRTSTEVEDSGNTTLDD